MVKYWIQNAVKSHKKGSLHKQLGIPMDKRIPKGLLLALNRRTLARRLGIRLKRAREGLKLLDYSRKGQF